MKTQIARLVAAVMVLACFGCGDVADGQNPLLDPDNPMQIGQVAQELAGSWAVLGYTPIFRTPGGAPGSLIGGQDVQSYNGPGYYRVWLEQYDCYAGACKPYLVYQNRWGVFQNVGRTCSLMKPQAYVDGVETAVLMKVAPRPVGDLTIPAPEIALVGGNTAVLPPVTANSPEVHYIRFDFPHRPRVPLNGMVEVQVYMDCGSDAFDQGELVRAAIVESHLGGYFYGTALGVGGPWVFQSPDGAWYSFGQYLTIDGFMALNATTGQLQPGGSQVVHAASGAWHWVDMLIK